jgi:hypothetical protein
MHVVIDVPAAQEAATADFWERALGWPVGEHWRDHPELRSFEPSRGSAYVHLQRIGGPPRVHLDLESEEPNETVGRAVQLGAGLVYDSGTWRSLRSPGGLPFCVLSARAHRPPEPVQFDDGHRARMVQVCVDAPRRAHEREVEFWRSLVRGQWVSSSDPEFAGKWHDDEGSPIQLLFQQLQEVDGPVRAHLDLGTDDLGAEVRRLAALGATDVGRGRGWHVLRDVAGQHFCVTPNSPEQTRHRDLG